MSKSNITKKTSLSIRGILKIDKEENSVFVEVEDGTVMELGALLQDFDCEEISMSVTESVDLA